MKDVVLSIVAILCIFVGLPVLLLWLWDKIFYRPKTPAEQDEYSRQFDERLANPEIDLMEDHFGHPLPEALVALYQNAAELARDNFEVVPEGADESASWFVAYYTPLDAEALDCNFHDSEMYLQFANDGCGNAYIIDPRKSDPPVFFHDHETGDMEAVAPSLTAFLGWERREPAD